MSRRKTGKISPDVASLRRRIERWRQTRLKRSPMPEDLWLEAARLAQDQGISPIARQLGVGYASLKDRVEQALQPNEDAPSQGASSSKRRHPSPRRSSRPGVILRAASQLGRWA